MAIPSRQIGWGTESNLLWQILKQLNKLTSVLFGLKEAATPKYKVFTALLSQNGESSSDVLSGGDLVIGRTYRIKDTGTGFDFTNVGAPNNNYFTSFIATGTTPNSWADGQLIYDIATPTAIILENTIGNIWFEYRAAGIYRCNSDNLFTLNKTTVFISDTVNFKSPTDPLQMRVLCSLDKNIQPAYLDIYTGTLSPSYENSVISNEGSDQYAVTFEIRVYN